MTDEVGKHSKGAFRAARQFRSPTLFTHEMAELISRETSDLKLAEALRAAQRKVAALHGLLAHSHDETDCPCALAEQWRGAEKLLEGLCWLML